MVRVLVVHDAGLLRSALVELLRTDPALEVTSTTPSDCLRRTGHHPAAGSGDPSVDVRVVDGDCMASCNQCEAVPGAQGGPGGREPGLVVLATPEQPGLLRRALDAGALGLVDKNASRRHLITAVHAVAKGERHLDASLAFALLDATAPPLTHRELRVVTLAGQGAPMDEIAALLHLSRGTVRNYMASAIRKVGARNRMDAIRIVRDAGWA
ncbi:response regulator transcription factor [Streptomyces sp. C10-9-1]|uniref:response regulator transcription factor n=1 Tax=Streptomyces sp. C10-9-1 TaxID=1859285 RepID=UPI002113834C|nr:response regulator transcription factor [Streptomyces sp. C10-9-1]MCQ6556245.1 response regulator transcription factor [Streptomyces sp. C10-9-1]